MGRRLIAAAALVAALFAGAGANACGHRYARILWDKPAIAARQGIRDYWDYELDHKIPLCLGGADSLENLQLQPWPEALAKDEDEITLCKDVCAGVLTREEAVGILAGNWLRQAPEGKK